MRHKQRKSSIFKPRFLTKMRGQMEIMGLTIVVILVILGILFGIRVMSRPETDIAKEFKTKTMSVNYLNVLLGTTTDCHKATFRELIQDCGQGGTIYCGGDTAGSCDYVDYYFEEIFNQTLTKINKKYYFTADGPGNVKDIDVGEPCKGARSRGTQYVPSRRGTITITLDICE